MIDVPDDTITALGIFDDHTDAAGSDRRELAWIEHGFAPLLVEAAAAVAGPVIAHSLA